MKTYERIAIAIRLYDVRCDIEVLQETLRQLPRVPESLRDGIVHILEDGCEELAAVESLIRPEIEAQKELFPSLAIEEKKLELSTSA